MLRLLTSVAAFFLGYLVVSAARGWVQAAAGQDARATVSDWVVVAFGLILAVTLMPRMVEGMREILAEPATGPVRLPSIRRRSR